ncbi:ribosome maturation factor RimM [Treponema pectinovorum]|uniref:ribosome maturation factor RimM n=1 Tax=Treponema pectinovorum TaxID=164 RepID=UPI0011C89D72|nr:PRC-barrel domain-containing protein [Treponema pectinovorum]
MTEQFIVGFIRGSHGVSGNMKIESASGEYEHFYSMKEVTLRDGKTGDSKVFKVESLKVGADTLYLKLVGIDSSEDVRKLNGWQIVVPRKYAKKLGKNEWYVEDLKNCALDFYPEQAKDGLAVWTAPAVGKAVTVGTITDVIEGGSGNLLEILLAENCDLLEKSVESSTKKGKRRTVYVPFNPNFVRNVDVKNKHIQLMHLWILE